jgi:uncharacterized protein YicC (UPF0701 family)
MPKTVDELKAEIKREIGAELRKDISELLDSLNKHIDQVNKNFDSVGVRLRKLELSGRRERQP